MPIRGDAMLDDDPRCDIIILTYDASPRRHPEAPRPPSDGHAQSAARPGDRRPDSDFFDPHDLLQVKYEMLRRVRRDAVTVSQAARLFGFSRPSFYHARDAFTRGGLGALVPQKRGP